MRGSGPSEAISSSLMPEVRNRAEAALAVGQPERRVARAGQLPRAVDEPLEDVLDRQLGRDREHRVADRPQRGLRRSAIFG